jgi:intracellular septation protein A
MCTSFKGDLLTGVHNFGTGVIRAATTADTFKAALYLASATIDASTTAYTATGEVSGSGYTAGGVTVTFGTAPSTSGTTAFVTPSASITYAAVTLATAFDCVLIYNSTQSNKAVSVHTFGSQTVTAGTFTLTMPTNDASTGLIRLA